MKFKEFLDEKNEKNNRLDNLVSSQLITLIRELQSEHDIQKKLNILGLMILVSTVPTLPDSVGIKLIR